MTPAQRKSLYAVAAAAAALAMGYGLLNDSTAQLWLGLVAALLGNGVAFFNTDTNTPGRYEKGNERGPADLD